MVSHSQKGHCIAVVSSSGERLDLVVDSQALFRIEERVPRSLAYVETGGSSRPDRPLPGGCAWLGGAVGPAHFLMRDGAGVAG